MNLFSSQTEQDAAAVYKQILEVVPQEKTSLFYLGDIYFRAERWDIAISYLKKGVASFPQQHEMHVRLADCYLEKGEYANAIEHYRTALSLIKNDDALIEQVKVRLGAAYYRGGQRDTGIALFSVICCCCCACVSFLGGSW